MAVIRLFLLLVVLGCLVLLLVQNWSPVLPLVFLGARTQPLPLAIWIVFSIAAGAITSLFISACFTLSNYFSSSQPKRRQVAASPRSNTTRPESTRTSESYTNPNSYTTSTSPPKTAPTPSEDFNDWESNSSEDWNFEQETKKTDDTPKPEPQDTVRETKNYEANNEPKSSSAQSSYSYSYREPSNSGVGKTESIYDADYRVLTPPYRQETSENKNQNDDDWGDDDWGLDDEDWGNEDDNDSPRQKR